MPGPAVEKVLFRAYVGHGTLCCHARFFADHVMVHPTLGTAIRGLHAAEDFAAAPALAATLVAAAARYASVLGFEVVARAPGRFVLAPMLGALQAVAAAAERAGSSDATLRERCPEPGGSRYAFRPCTEAGAHALRVAA